MTIQNIVIKGVFNMVKLFNIKKSDNLISCNYTPETSSLKGFVEVDAKTQEVSKVEYSEYEYGKKTYVAHVRSKLSELLSANKPIPKEIVVSWY